MMDGNSDTAALRARQAQAPPPGGNAEFMDQFSVNDTGAFLTSDAGGPIEDQASLRAGARGPTVLEDFILRQKIMHFDHERVSGAGAIEDSSSQYLTLELGPRASCPRSWCWRIRHVYI